jgi:hypothetical protein
VLSTGSLIVGRQIYVDKFGRGTGKKTALFAPFIYKNQHFTKTGSGQT